MRKRSNWINAVLTVIDANQGLVTQRLLLQRMQTESIPQVQTDQAGAVRLTESKMMHTIVGHDKMQVAETSCHSAPTAIVETRRQLAWRRTSNASLAYRLNSMKASAAFPKWLNRKETRRYSCETLNRLKRFLNAYGRAWFVDWSTSLTFEVTQREK
jgi:hypothetical protein